jgi:hypothetical protein
VGFAASRSVEGEMSSAVVACSASVGSFRASCFLTLQASAVDFHNQPLLACSGLQAA